MPEPRSVWGHIVALSVLGGGFYALVIYPVALGDLINGAIIGFMGAAIQWEFGNATAGATARQQQNATDSGAAAGAMVPGTTTTISAGPPMEVTTTPAVSTTPSVPAPVEEEEDL